MSFRALTGRNPSGQFQNNCKRLYIVYTPATPITVPLGQEFDLANVFPGNPTMSAQFKTKQQGTFDVMTRVPLSLLCALYGLENNKAAYMTGTSQLASGTSLGAVTGLAGTLDAIPPTNVNVPVTGTASTGTAIDLVQQIESISFSIELFENGRIFGSGDLLDLAIYDMPASANIDVYICDSPYMNEYSKPFKFRSQTVLAGNDYQVSFADGQNVKLIFPNDAGKVDSVQMQGSQYVQWDLIDFYANAESDWISNKTTYNSSPYIFLETAYLQNIKFKAIAQFQFFYKTKF